MNTILHYPADTLANRNSAFMRNNPLTEDDLPFKNQMPDGISPTEAIYSILDYLDVEKSLRYASEGPDKTYCSIYIYDYCYLCNAYLPVVWWTGETLAEIRAGKNIEPVFGVNTKALNSFESCQWLIEFGAEFGWKQSSDLTDLQEEANRGKVAIIAAARATRVDAHFVCVIPETAENQAKREGARVVYPLQSFAGRNNKKIYVSEWMSKHEKSFISFSYWYNG